MPLLRSETVHGVVCKFYDGCVVKVGTTAAARFTIKVPADEATWFSTRLRAELIKRELATAAELPIDEAGEAAMAAKAAAKAREADSKQASKTIADVAAAKVKAASTVDAARYHEKVAEHKRRRAEMQLKVADKMDNMAKVGRVMEDLVQQLPELAADAAPLLAERQRTLDSFLRRPVSAEP